MPNPTLNQLLTLAKACGLSDARIVESMNCVGYNFDEPVPWNWKTFGSSATDLVLVQKAMHEWARQQEIECRSGYWFDDAYGGADHWYVNFLPDIKGTGQTFESAWLDAALKWNTIVKKEKKYA